jgi:hypothetical protein
MVKLPTWVGACRFIMAWWLNNHAKDMQTWARPPFYLVWRSISWDTWFLLVEH